MYADPVKKVQEELYQQLLVLREGLYQTMAIALEQPVSANGTVGPAQGEGPASEEGKKLKEDNTKLKYRVKFLKNTIEEMEAGKK